MRWPEQNKAVTEFGDLGSARGRLGGLDKLHGAERILREGERDTVRSIGVGIGVSLMCCSVLA